MSDPGTLILFPRSYAREEHISRSLRDGISVIATSRIDDVYHFYRSVYDAIMPARTVLTGEAAQLVMQFAADEHAVQGSALAPLMRSQSFAREAFALYETLARYGEAREMMSVPGGHADAFADIFGRYERLLAERGLIDAVSDVRIFFTKLAAGRPAPLAGITHIACRGFLSFNELYRRFFSIIADTCRIPIIVHVPASREQFSALTAATMTSAEELFIPGIRIEYGTDVDALSSSVINALIGGTSSPEGHARLSFLYSFGAYQEAETIAHAVDSLVRRGVPAHRIAVVGDIATLHRPLTDAFAHLALPVSSRRGDVLGDHPIARMLMTLFSIIDQDTTVDVDALSGLFASGMVTHPSCDRYRAHALLHGKKGLDLPERARASLIASSVDRLRTDDTSVHAFGVFVNETIARARTLTRARDFSEGVTHLRDLAEFLGFSRFADAMGDDMRGIYASVLEALDTLRVCDTVYRGEQFSIDDLRTAAARTLSALTRESGASRGGVRLLTPYDIRGAEFDHIIIGGCTEGGFSFSDNALLSDDMRRAIHARYPAMPLSPSSNNEELLLFCSVVLALAPAGGITCSLTARDERGNEVLPHPYMDAVMHAFEPALADASWETRARETFTPAVSVHSRARYVPTLVEARTRIDAENAIAQGASIEEATRATGSYIDDAFERDNARLLAMRMRTLSEKYMEALSAPAMQWFRSYIAGDISVTDLESIARCPGEFIARRLYRMDEMRIPLGGIEHADRGAYFHRIFERFYGTVRERYGSCALTRTHRDDYRSLIAEVIDTVTIHAGLAHEEGYARSEAHRIAKRFIDHEIALAEKSGFVPEYIEHTFEHHPLRHISIKGRIDRIDIMQRDGRITGIRVIDYKSSATVMKKDDVRSYRVLQPFLYLAYAIDMLSLYDACEKGDVQIECGYYAYSESALADKAYTPFTDKEIMRSFFRKDTEEMNIYAAVLPAIADLSAGMVRFRPDENSCRKCVYRVACPAEF
ncbi:MAG: PD-(D/E)XK nuclease family protein [Spirochaetota bacterium]